MHYIHTYTHTQKKLSRKKFEDFGFIKNTGIIITYILLFVLRDGTNYSFCRFVCLIYYACVLRSIVCE